MSKRRRKNPTPAKPKERNHLELLVETLYTLLGVRNVILADLEDYLTDDDKARLGWPLDRLDPAVAAEVQARGQPIPRPDPHAVRTVP
jgi:hypothetical protein